MQPQALDLTNWYGSIGGVVALTLGLSQGIKVMFGDTKWLKSVPIQVYVLGISMALVLLARQIGTLEGSLVKLMVDAAGAALAASGLFSWAQSGPKPISDTKAARSVRADKKSRKARLHVGFIIFALTGSLTMSACASRGPLHLQVASYAAEITRIGLQAQDAFFKADAAGLITDRDKAREANNAFRELGQGLQRVATVVEAYDLMSPTEQDTNRTKVEAVIAEARRLVRAALLFAGSGSDALGKELLTMFDRLDLVFAQITQALRPVPVGA